MSSGYFYRGRHRRPTHTGRNAAVIATTGAFALPLTMGMDAPAAHAGILDDIAQCESGGDPTVVNGSGHGGLFQFDLSTWRSVGGTGRPENASVSEQYARAQALLDARGTQPWAASAGCHGHSVAPGHTSSRTASRAAPRTAHAAPRAAPKTKTTARTSWAASAKLGTRSWANAPADLDRRDSQGHGRYVCDAAHLGYEACDAATLGQTVAYPAFD